MDSKTYYCAEHIKTGKTYFILAEAKDCTNLRDGSIVIIYRNQNNEVFVRDKEEFDKKFRRF